MSITHRPKIWTSAGVLALSAGLAACGGEGEGESEGRAPGAAGEAGEGQAAAPQFTEGEGEGSGGEGAGEGGSAGGEFGIDPNAAAQDPVVYLTAIEVMRAHYLAGIEALEAGQRQAGGEMFAHAISEIYIDFEQVLEMRGAPTFMDALNAAAAAPFDGSSDAEVRAAVERVLDGFDTAESFAPSGTRSDAAVHARVMADLLERAALQYRFAGGEAAGGEAYLDGFGFYRAAAGMADSLPVVEAADPAAAGHLVEALSALAAAYPSADRPERLAADANALVSRAEAAQAAAQALE